MPSYCVVIIHPRPKSLHVAKRQKLDSMLFDPQYFFGHSCFNVMY